MEALYEQETYSCGSIIHNHGMPPVMKDDWSWDYVNEFGNPVKMIRGNIRMFSLMIVQSSNFVVISLI